MKKSDAISIIQTTFNGVFDEQSFQKFIANLFKNYTPVNRVREGQYIREAFRQFISEYKTIGYFQDSEGNKIDILRVSLHKETSLERARTAQRNFVADYLKNNAQGRRDAALVAFIAPEEQDWRFSLVKLEYSLEVKEGKVKTSEDLTPAKRWSFLVGVHEGSHTAQSRFVSLLESNEEPNLRELEEAFNIEKVTNEFFEKYCELFLRMKESLDALLEKDPELKKDFELKEISTVDFAKKTLGQMAFLYFLQKKGWFGVAPDKHWGSGAKNFLRELFTRREKYGKNFFDDVLEPLFYEALAVDRGNEAIYTRLNNCRMPFLNGGLFEPMNGYAWETTHIALPDELFSNTTRTKEGDTGDGILDVFDRYNFTVNENEPLEKEVAVDPEMLGKVFELEIKDRKSKGAFYTPREIVHYMCQESLINYLHSETGEAIPREDIEEFIQKGIQILQNDKTTLEKHREAGKKGQQYKGEYAFMLRESIRSKVSELDQLLANIKVCDPAVGSGAFPLGMLNEIVRARQVLGVHLGSDPSPYDLKLHTISHSIYGVDIDSGAVEIAKLRMWLALVVEEQDPHPLPNLEHKIMQGNSLLSEYEGIKLFDDSFLADVSAIEREKKEISEKISSLQREYFDLHSKDQLTPIKKVQIEQEMKSLHKRQESLNPQKATQEEKIGIFDIPTKKRVAQEKTEMLQKKIEQFVSESRKTQKQNLKEEIDTLKWELIEATLEEQGRTDKLEEIRGLRRKNIRPFFIWKLEFSDVFRDKGGFDVMMGNPPYGGEKITDDMKKKMEIGSKDIYGAFISRSIHGENALLKSRGILSYIVSDTFMTIKSHRELRKQILNNKINRIIRLHPDTFKVTVNTCILLLEKKKDTENLCEMADMTNISVHEEYQNFLKILNQTLLEKDISTSRYAIFHYAQKLIAANSNLSFFVGHPRFFRFMSDISSKFSNEENIVIARKIELNGEKVEILKFGDIAEVRQGLATGDNNYYIYQNPQARGNYKSILDYREFLFTEDDLQKVSMNENIRKKAIERGFHKNRFEDNFDEDLWFEGRYILPYDKGGASDLSEGWLPNYFVPTDYFIDWSIDSVHRMKTLTAKERDGKGDNKICSRFQNSETYFKKGLTFSWTGQYSPTFRFAVPAPYDHGSSDIFCDILDFDVILGLVCSKFIKFIARNIINHTVNFGIDDVKDFPILLQANNDRLKKLVANIFQKQKLNPRYDYMSNEQKEIDKLIYEMYGLDNEEIQEVEKWYARRYSKLRAWCYIAESASSIYETAPDQREIVLKV